MKTTWTVLILLIILISISLSQNSDQVISVNLYNSVDKLKAGNSHRLAVEVSIQSPYHINAQEPSEDYLIPTTVDLSLPDGVTTGRFTFPQPELKKFAFSEKRLAVYENTIYIYTTLTLPPDFPAGELNIQGSVGYQACDEHTCLPPAELIFNQKFPVGGSEESVNEINQEVFSQRSIEAQEKISETDKQSLSRTIEEKGLFITFILVFIAGLALNLTPCVYPLIPITISYFGGQGEGKKGNLILHAVVYVLGMAVTYSILGVIAALTGGLFGAALQNPIVLLVIAAILVGLSLSMFDLYEIRVPAFLSNFAGGAKKGIFGTLFMGLTVGIVAAPCIGPFVLALLTYVGERGDVILGFWMFFVLALGLGLPFLFLGIFSGSIHKLPRSGAWMIWVRAIFGFILIALAVYFLQPLFPNTLYYHLSLALILFIGGIYMAWLEPTKAQGRIFPVIRNIVGILFFVPALLLAASGIKTYVEEAIHESRVGMANAISADEIRWQEYSEEQLTIARQEETPVMIDFYADWCIPCKELDKFTFSEPEVVELSRQFLMLKVDLTRADDPQAKKLKNRYNIRGVPTLVFISPGGEELDKLRVVGYMEKEEFLPIMQSALE